MVTCVECEGVASCVRNGGVPKTTAKGEFLYKCGDGACKFSRAERTREDDSLEVHGDDAAPAPAPPPAAKRTRMR